MFLSVGLEKIAEDVIKVVEGGEDMTMLEASIKKYKEQMQQLYEKGFEEGIEKGIEKGRLEGLNEGIEKAMYETALKMIEKGLSLDLISELTGLSMEKINKLKNNKNNKR